MLFKIVKYGIQCDRCGSTLIPKFHITDESTCNRESIEKLAKEKGWQLVTNNLTLCPKCTEEHQTHKLKILPQYFGAVVTGTKKFELRKDDRNFKVGDYLKLMEWDDTKKEYTDVFAYRRIEYILRNCPEYGLQDGYCILGF